MCLRLKKSFRKNIAKRDITCYKIIETQDNKFVSFYMNYPITFGKTLHSNIGIYGSSIEEAFHSYTKLNVVEKEFHSFETWYSTYKSVIVKCIIPKGATYYLNYDNTEYASDQIKYIKILKNFKY